MAASQQQAEKEAVAAAAAARVPDGCRLGLGSGSTLELFVPKLAARVKQGLRVTCVPTSKKIAALATTHGLALDELGAEALDLAIDGADEVDPARQLVKGAGGALVRERMVAAAAKKFLVVVDSTKLVARLGERMPLPVEIQTFGAARTALGVGKILGGATLRVRDGAPFVSDNAGYILDCPLPPTADLRALAAALRAVPGVVDTGLFLDFNPEVLVGRGSRVETI